MDNVHEIERKVIEILSKEWHLSTDQIPGNARLGQFENWDSMGHVQIMLCLQKYFGFQLTPALVQELVSISAIVEYINNENLVCQ